jgi:hypothetical protein
MTYPNDILMDLSKKFNLDKIIYFIVLSDKKSFKKASDELYITQQALSFSIQSLEKELNVRLINRESKYDFLTEDGKIFLESAKQIIHNFNQMFKIKSNVPQNVETLDIYYTFIWSGDLILEIVEQIKMIHTELKINTILINTQMIFNKDFKFKKNNFIILSNKKIDIDIFNCFQSKEVNFVIVGSPQKYNKKYKWDDLEYIYFNSDKLNLGSDFIVWSDNEYKRKILFDTMLHDTAIDLCLKSFGAFFFADIMLKNYLKNKELVIVSDVPFEYNRNIIPTVSWIFDNDLINDSVDICKKILNNWFYDESTR